MAVNFNTNFHVQRSRFYTQLQVRRSPLRKGKGKDMGLYT